MEIKKLKSMPYAQAQVRIYTDENNNIYKIVLQSYATDVVIVYKEWVIVKGLYSQTTRRHISVFCSEYLPFSYYTLRDLYHNDEVINKETGEVLKAQELEKLFNAN